MPIYCVIRVIISLSKKPIFHSKVKRIEIKHHFKRDHLEKGTVDLYCAYKLSTC